MRVCALLLVLFLCVLPVRAQTPLPEKPLTARDALHFLLTDPQAAKVRAQVENAPAELLRQQTLAATEGIPLTPADLQKPPPIDDAAPLYDSLSRVLRHTPVEKTIRPPLSTQFQFSPAEIDAERRAVKGRPDVFRLLHIAASRPQCVFVRDWSQGEGVLFPEYATLRSGARLLRTQGFLLAEDGHAGQAVNCELLGFNIARHARADPAVIGYVTGLACDRITLAGLTDILQMAGRQPGLAMKVHDAIMDNRGYGFALAHALGGDAARMQIALARAQTEYDAASFWFDVRGNVREGTPPAEETGTPLSASETDFLHNLLTLRRAQELEDDRRLVRAAKLNDEQRRPAFDALSRELWPPPDPFTDEPAPPPKDPVVQALNAAFPPLRPSPSLFMLADREIAAYQQSEVIAAACTILRDWQETGKLPPTLASEYTDFFGPEDNGTLQYRRVGRNGFTVSSIGPAEFDLNSKAIVHRHPVVFAYPAHPVPLPPYWLFAPSAH